MRGGSSPPSDTYHNPQLCGSRFVSARTIRLPGWQVSRSPSCQYTSASSARLAFSSTSRMSPSVVMSVWISSMVIRRFPLTVCDRVAASVRRAWVSAIRWATSTAGHRLPAPRGDGRASGRNPRSRGSRPVRQGRVEVGLGVVERGGRLVEPVCCQAAAQPLVERAEHFSFGEINVAWVFEFVRQPVLGRESAPVVQRSLALLALHPPAAQSLVRQAA